MSNEPKSRPLGVSLIAIYAGFVAILPLAVSVKFLVDENLPAWAALVQSLPALVMFAFVIGLWRLRRWGLWLAIFYYAFTLLWTLPDIIGALGSAGSEYPIYTVITGWQFLVAGVILSYLLQPSTRNLFKTAMKKKSIA